MGDPFVFLETHQKLLLLFDYGASRAEQGVSKLMEMSVTFFSESSTYC